jgi:hypothetical protein
LAGPSALTKTVAVVVAVAEAIAAIAVAAEGLAGPSALPDFVAAVAAVAEAGAEIAEAAEGTLGLTAANALGRVTPFRAVDVGCRDQAASKHNAAHADALSLTKIARMPK